MSFFPYIFTVYLSINFHCIEMPFSQVSLFVLIRVIDTGNDVININTQAISTILVLVSIYFFLPFFLVSFGCRFTYADNIVRDIQIFKSADNRCMVERSDTISVIEHILIASKVH